MKHLTEKERLPKRRVTAVVLVSLSILVLAAVIFFIVALSMRREDFKRASDYEFVKQYVATAEETLFFDAAMPFVEEKLTVYEDRAQVMAKVRGLLMPENLTFARAESYTEEKPVYTLYAEAQEIFTLTLALEKKSLSGYPRWKAAELVPSENCALGHDLTVEVPKGAILTVSGVTLSREQAESAPYHGLTEFEASLSETYRCERYVLGRFFLTPEPSVVLDGIRLQAASVDDAILRYGYPPSYTSSVTLTVPYGASVKINGVTLSGEYLVESGVPYPFLTRFEADLPESPTAVVYQVSGLFRAPSVEVVSGGAVLSDDGAGGYRLPESLTKTVTVCAPENAVVKINGVSLGASERVGGRLELPIFEGVTSYAKERPYLVRYRVTGLLTEPVLTASDGEGNVLTVSPYYSTEEESVFVCADAGEVPEKELLTVKTFAENYVKYTFGGVDGIGKNYNNVTAMTPAKTPAFSVLKEAYQGLYDAPVHKSIRFGEIKVLRYHVYSDVAYSAVVTLPFTSKSDGESLSTEITMEILYVYVGSVRRIVNFKVLNTVTQGAE